MKEIMEERKTMRPINDRILDLRQQSEGLELMIEHIDEEIEQLIALRCDRCGGSGQYFYPGSEVIDQCSTCNGDGQLRG